MSEFGIKLGMLPSCHLCQWAAHTDKLGEIYCRLHEITVFRSYATFCPDLSNDAFSDLAAFTASQPLQPGKLYKWLGAASADPAHPPFSQPDKESHEYRALAPIKEYASWIHEQMLEYEQALAQEDEEVD